MVRNVRFKNTKHSQQESSAVTVRDADGQGHVTCPSIRGRELRAVLVKDLNDKQTGCFICTRSGHCLINSTQLGLFKPRDVDFSD